jgi:hypothetical protein
MTNEIQLNIENRIIDKDFISKVTALEQEMLNSDLPGIVKGDSDSFPLKHSFADGIYIRELFASKGSLVIGKIHKFNHTWFLLSGELEIATDQGINHYIAPCYINAPGGTKRVVHVVEDSVFVNVYPNPNNTTDLIELEEMIISPSFEEYEKYKLLKK